MRILLVGGGSGGHVTPLKAVAKSLLAHPNVKVSVVSDNKFISQTRQIFKDTPQIPISTIYSGKLRRYHGKSLIWHIYHLPTLLLNIRDMFLTAVGLIQSFGLIRRSKADIIFCKGGFVCLPLGVAARILNVPFVIHDSDTQPGLTNRILARWSYKIATGMPSKYYSYEPSKMAYVGIPVNSELRPVSNRERDSLKKELGLDDKPLLLITGGGLGSLKLNSIVAKAAEGLLQAGWQIVHITGANKDQSVKKAKDLLNYELKPHWVIKEFVPLTPYILASDLIISRTGASAMQEFANARKPVITIPGKHLSGGHQVKNADMFNKAKSVVMLDEDDLEQNPGKLNEVVSKLAADSNIATEMAKNLYEGFAKPQAAEELADLLISSVSK